MLGNSVDSFNRYKVNTNTNTCIKKRKILERVLNQFLLLFVQSENLQKIADWKNDLREVKKYFQKIATTKFCQIRQTLSKTGSKNK